MLMTSGLPKAQLTIEPTKASIEKVALGAEFEQVVVHLGLGNVLKDVNSDWEALQLCAVVCNLQAALVGL